MQLIDASGWFLSRCVAISARRICELAEADIQHILDLYLGEAQETAQSKWFDTAGLRLLENHRGDARCA